MEYLDDLARKDNIRRRQQAERFAAMRAGADSEGDRPADDHPGDDRIDDRDQGADIDTLVDTFVGSAQRKDPDEQIEALQDLGITVGPGQSWNDLRPAIASALTQQARQGDVSPAAASTTSTTSGFKPAGDGSDYETLVAELMTLRGKYDRESDRKRKGLHKRLSALEAKGQWG